jgi:hypothetical protein
MQAKEWLRKAARALTAGSVVVAILSGTAEAKPAPTQSWPAPLPPDQGVQVGVESALLPDGLVERAEMKLQHSCFQAPQQGAYSHSLVARTDAGWTLHWGVIVLAADVNNAACPAGLGGGSMGWGRYFLVVRDAAGQLVYSKLSRAGAANPPPAASSTSGGSPDGYVFAIRRVNNTWKFYFDGIQKYQYSAPGSRLDQLYFVGESAGGAIIDDRVGHIAFRAWPGGPDGGWWQPVGRALYHLSPQSCDDADLERYDNVPGGGIDLHWTYYQSVRVGDVNSGACNYSDGAPIW